MSEKVMECGDKKEIDEPCGVDEEDVVYVDPNQMNLLEEIDGLKTKYVALQKEWNCQQEHLARVQSEVYRLRNQLQTQSSFCASLGAILGNLVWKASRLQPVVELLLTTNKLSEFFCLASGTLVSFMETYSKDVPDSKTDETQFILAMGGIVANIAAVPEGRQFLVTDTNGAALVSQIVQLLPSISPGSGDPLKRILLMALYNVSINQSGLVLLQDQKPLLISIGKTIACDRNPELQLMSLRLLESLTCEIASPQALLKIKQHIPIQRLLRFGEAVEPEGLKYAQSILNNIGRAEDNLNQINPGGYGQPPFMPYSEHCFMSSSSSTG